MLRHSKTAAPTELLLVNMDVVNVHLLIVGSNLSTELSDELPSFPPSAYKILFICATSCVDLKKKKRKYLDFFFFKFK